MRVAFAWCNGVPLILNVSACYKSNLKDHKCQTATIKRSNSDLLLDREKFAECHSKCYPTTVYLRGLDLLISMPPCPVTKPKKTPARLRYSSQDELSLAYNGNPRSIVGLFGSCQYSQTHTSSWFADREFGARTRVLSFWTRWSHKY